MGRRPIYCLVLCAVLMALSFVLGMIKIIPMPYGGSITHVQHAGCDAGGLLLRSEMGSYFRRCALGLLNLIIDPVILFPMQVVLDYVLGVRLPGAFRVYSAIRKHGLYVGYHRCDHRQIHAAPSSPVFSSSVNTRRRA